jgi:hypothetical protein
MVMTSVCPPPEPRHTDEIKYDGCGLQGLETVAKSVVHGMQEWPLQTDVQVAICSAAGAANSAAAAMAMMGFHFFLPCGQSTLVFKVCQTTD